MQAIRYRTGIDRYTGRLLTGRAHLAQSIATIWTTQIGERFMLLDYGSELRSRLGEDVIPALAAAIYDDLVTSVHRWEPEYRIRELQLVSLTRQGGLGLRHAGAYYPEGRFGNYALVERFGWTSDYAAMQRLAQGATARGAA